MRKVKIVITFLLAAITLTGCSPEGKDSSVYRVSMVASIGGINDQSFNQLSWEGLQSFAQNTGSDVRVLESKQASDYLVNFDRATDIYSDLIWGVGYQLADAMLTVSQMNPDIDFAIIDSSYEECPDNVTGVIFQAEESSFLTGYAAGLSTATEKIGYIGPMKSKNNDRFQYGYLAGAAYAAKERDIDLFVWQQFVESYTDVAKAKAIANKMYTGGCDIIFHSAGGAGYGVIESAKENEAYVIGVDSDQSYLAPGHVLTSGLKNVNIAVELLSAKAMNGEEIGGQTFYYGLKEDCVGIPKENPNMDPAVYERTIKIEEMIEGGEIIPPVSEEEYYTFLEGLE